MKKIILFALCAQFVAVGFAEELDGIAARVGADSILKSEVILEMKRANVPESAYRQFLEEMIDRKLILKAALDAKMTMQEWVIESRIRDIVKRAFDGDRNKLMETLSQQKISYPEWYARMKDDMIVQAMRWNVIDKNISPSPAEMKAEFSAHPERYRVPDKVSVTVVSLKPAEYERRAEVNLAMKTNDLAKIGTVYKDVDPKETFNEGLCARLEKMKVGETSNWFTISDWSFLIRKDAETPGKKPTFAEAYDEIENNLRMELGQSAYEKWVKRLRDEAFIKVY